MYPFRPNQYVYPNHTRDQSVDNFNDSTWPRQPHMGDFPHPNYHQTYDYNPIMSQPGFQYQNPQKRSSADFSQFTNYPEDHFNSSLKVNTPPSIQNPHFFQPNNGLYDLSRAGNFGAIAAAEAAVIDSRNSSWVKTNQRVAEHPFRMPDPYSQRPRTVPLESPARYANYVNNYSRPYYPPHLPMRPCLPQNMPIQYPQFRPMIPDQRRMYPNVEPGGLYRQPSDLKRLLTMGNEPDRPHFVNQLISLYEENGINITSLPVVAKQVIDLYILYKKVRELGGSIEVHKNRKWKDLAMLLTGNNSTSSSYSIKRNYIKFLLPYECKYELNTDPFVVQQILEPRRERRTPTRDDIPDDLSYLTSPSPICPDSMPVRFPSSNPGLDQRQPAFRPSFSDLSSPVYPPVVPPTQIVRHQVHRIVQEKIQHDPKQIVRCLKSSLPMHVFFGVLALAKISSQSVPISSELTRMLLLTYNGSLFYILLNRWIESLKIVFSDDFGGIAVVDEEEVIYPEFEDSDNQKPNFPLLNSELEIKDPSSLNSDKIRSLCKNISHILRNISFISINHSPLSQSRPLIRLLCRVLTFSSDFSTDPLRMSIFEDSFVILSNITVFITGDLVPLLVESIIPWIKKVSTDSTSLLWLATECLNNLAANKKNVFLILKSVSSEDLSAVFKVLAKELYTEDIVIREMNTSLLCLLANSFYESPELKIFRNEVVSSCSKELVRSIIYFLDTCRIIAQDIVKSSSRGDLMTSLNEFLICQGILLLENLTNSILQDGTCPDEISYLKFVFSSNLIPLYCSDCFVGQVRCKLELLVYRFL